MAVTRRGFLGALAGAGAALAAGARAVRGEAPSAPPPLLPKGKLEPEMARPREPSVLDALVRGADRVIQEGGKPSKIYLHPADFARARVEMDELATYPSGGPAECWIGTVRGRAHLVPDPTVDLGFAYIVDESRYPNLPTARERWLGATVHVEPVDPKIASIHADIERGIAELSRQRLTLPANARYTGLEAWLPDPDAGPFFGSRKS